MSRATLGYPTSAEKDAELVRAGDLVHYLATHDYIRTHDVRANDVYARIGAMIDIHSFVEYRAIEILTSRWDLKNHRLWRPRTADGRWQWLYFDFDVSFGGKAFNGKGFTPEFDLLAAMLNPDGSLGGHNSPTNTFLLRTLLTNASFRSSFIQRVEELLRTTYIQANVVARIDQMAATLAPEMGEHIERWRIPSSVDVWKTSIEDLREFARQMPPAARRHLAKNLETAPP
jgi:hypothetical protein